MEVIIADNYINETLKNASNKIISVYNYIIGYYSML